MARALRLEKRMDAVRSRKTRAEQRDELTRAVEIRRGEYLRLREQRSSAAGQTQDSDLQQTASEVDAQLREAFAGYEEALTRLSDFGAKLSSARNRIEESASVLTKGNCRP
jgi:hypothetical protein